MLARSWSSGSNRLLAEMGWARHKVCWDHRRTLEASLLFSLAGVARDTIKSRQQHSDVDEEVLHV